MFQGTLQLYLYGGIVFYCVIFHGFVLSISYYYSNSLLLTFCPVLTEEDKHPMEYHNFWLTSFLMWHSFIKIHRGICILSL